MRKKFLSSFLSPAKLNLFFRVLHKRADGYHEIASLYQAIDLCDRLFFIPSKTDKITCTDPTLPLDESNLIIQALKLFRCRYSTSTVEIHLEKHIPVHAGLGGGSSNAATTLWALNELFGKPASTKELIEMGSRIGSDVPFFFSLGTAYCTGRGENLEPFILPAPLNGTLVKPKYGLSTPDVYLYTTPQTLKKRDPTHALENYPIFFNDLEPAAFKLEPRLQRLHNRLKKHFSQVVMTGSGSTFFCLDGSFKPSNDIFYESFQSIQRPTDLKWYQKG